MRIRSLLTKENPFNSTTEIRQWIERCNMKVDVKVTKIPSLRGRDYTINVHKYGAHIFHTSNKENRQKISLVFVRNV